MQVWQANRSEWSHSLNSGLYLDHPSMVCTSKVFMGDSDKVEESEQMVKLAIQQFGFCGAPVAGVVVADQKTLQRPPML